MLKELFILFTFLSIAVAGCGRYEGGYKLPGVYRIDIQQGNVIEQDMIDKLKPGMDKNQVRFIMGTPVVVDSFHTNQWEYIYTFSHRGGTREQRHLTLYFENEKLAYIDGDIKTGVRKPPEEIRRQRQSVDVPLRKRKKGFFSKLLDSVPFVGDDENEVKKTDKEENTENEESASTEEKPDDTSTIPKN